MKKIIILNMLLVFTLAAFSQNFGVDKANPTEKVDVNGNAKAHAIVFPDGSKQSKAPRVIHTTDPRGGCPPAHAANTDLFAQNFTTTATSAYVEISAAIIRNSSGRHDLFLYVDGVIMDRTLTYTSSAQWEDAYVQWAGTLGAGNHTVSLRSPSANIWGCTGSWGSIDTIIFE